MLESGSRFGAYEVRSPLGAGGMGEVYRAHDTRLKRDVALKVLPDRFAQDPQRLARFQREGEVLAALNHRHIAAVYSLEQANGVTAIAMELVEGETLHDRIARGPVPFQKALAIAEQIADALEAAHEQGIVHRDLKPANIKLTPEDDVKVLDFGLAYSAALSSASDIQARSELASQAVPIPAEVMGFGDTVTRPLWNAAHSVDPTQFKTSGGAIIGTVGFMSPEQVNGEAVTPASDMFSLGLVLQELFTGRPPYDRSLSYEALLEKARSGETLPVTGVDADAATLVRRLKSRAPAQRPTAVECMARLQRIREKPRRRMVRGAIAAGLILLAAGVTKYTVDLARERDRASREAQVSQQVIEFLTGLFRVPDPSESRGRSVTARELLDAGARQIDSLKDQPEVQARLMATMGDSFQGLGLYPDAQTQLEKTLDTRRRALGPDHADTLRAMSALATVYVLRQQYDAAERLYRETLPLQEQRLGPEHPDRLAALQDLGWLVGRKGNTGEGEKMVVGALEAERRLLGNEHPNTLKGMNRLANIMAWEGRYADQERLLREELTLRQRVQGADHPYTIGGMRQLAGALSEQGRFDEAELVNREVLAAANRVFGPDHANTAAAMNDLANTLDRAHRPTEAEKLFLAAIDVSKRALGAESDSTLLSINNLGVVYLNEHRYREADALLTPLLDTSIRVRGPDHQRTLNVMNNLALVHENLGRHDEAARLLRDVITRARTTLGENHPLTAVYMVSLSEVMAHQGRRDEALNLVQEAVDHGYHDADAIAMDEYFVSFAGNRRFEAILQTMRKLSQKP